MHRKLMFRLSIIKFKLFIYRILPLNKKTKDNLAEKVKKEMLDIMKITNQRIKELLNESEEWFKCLT